MAYFKITTVLSMVALVSSDSSSNEIMQKLSLLEKTGEFRESALKKAGEWFQAHQDPQGDAGDQAGMKELKASNPEAWAVVNALLTKKSLGLLNSRHPTASMSPSDRPDAPLDSPQAEPQATFTAPQAQAAAPRVVAPQVAAPELDVPGAAESEVDVPVKHHDFLHWKPADDEQMVSKVLGMAAELTGKGGSVAQASETVASPPKNIQATAVKAEDPPAQPQAQPEQQPQHHASVLSFDWGNTYAGFETQHDTRSSSASPPLKARQDLSTNPYLKGIDFSSELGPSTMSQVAENSYLKSVNLNGGNIESMSKPHPKGAITAKDIGGPNKLTSFSWYN